MHLFSLILFGCSLCCLQVSAMLSPSSCSLLRSITSLTKIVPEITDLALRFYRPMAVEMAQTERLKRSIPNESQTKENNGQIRGTMIEQMIANTIRDVNFTDVIITILNNNDTKNKIEGNIDFDDIMRMIIRGLNHEKLIYSIWTAFGTHFDLEHFLNALISQTQLDSLHEQLLANGTLPTSVLQKIHPNLTSSFVRRISSTVRNFTSKFVRILDKAFPIDTYFFNTLMEQTIMPIGNIVQRVKEKKPKNFDQLVETMINSTNKIFSEKLMMTTQRTSTKKSTVTSTSTENPLEKEEEDVQWLLYQWSTAFSAMGQTARVLLKSLEQLYCASVWD